jgi:hypothetical protein
LAAARACGGIGGLAANGEAGGGRPGPAP